MTPEFWTVHSDLPRQGPGEPADVAWAIERASLGGAVRILDAGCGPGADIETFAAMLPEAHVTGVEMHAPFVEDARKRNALHAERITLVTGDMREIEGSYDLIWSAGAMYFVGVEEGLRLFRDRLAPGGHVCFTQPVTPSEATEADRAFWEGAAVTDEAGVAEDVRAAGFEVVGARRISDAAWEAYYIPMERRLAALRDGAPSEALERAVSAAEDEIARWRADGGRNDYLQLLVRPA